MDCMPSSVPNDFVEMRCFQTMRFVTAHIARTSRGKCTRGMTPAQTIEQHLGQRQHFGYIKQNRNDKPVVDYKLCSQGNTLRTEDSPAQCTKCIASGFGSVVRISLIITIAV